MASQAVYTAVSIFQPLLLQQLQDFYAQHPIGQTLLAKFIHSVSGVTAFHVQNGVVYYRGRLFIPVETGSCNIRIFSLLIRISVLYEIL